MTAKTYSSSGSALPRRPVTGLQGKVWTDDEKALLARMDADAVPVSYMAKRLKRSEKAVKAKLYELRYERDGMAFRDREKSPAKLPDYSGDNVETGGL